MKKQIEIEKYGVVDLTLTDERDTNGGFAAAAAGGAAAAGAGCGCLLICGALVLGVVVGVGIYYGVKAIVD